MRESNTEGIDTYLPAEVQQGCP